jgi:hypothetical protein
VDESKYLGEDYKLYEVNFKDLFSSTTPPQSKTHIMDLACLKEPLSVIHLTGIAELVNRKMSL